MITFKIIRTKEGKNRQRNAVFWDVNNVPQRLLLSAAEKIKANEIILFNLHLSLSEMLRVRGKLFRPWSPEFPIPFFSRCFVFLSLYFVTRKHRRKNDQGSSPCQLLVIFFFSLRIGATFVGKLNTDPPPTKTPLGSPRILLWKVA